MYISLPQIKLNYLIGSVPFLKTASDDIVACFAEILDRWVRLCHLVDLGVAIVLKRGTAYWLINLVGRRFLGGLLCSSSCPRVKSTLLEQICLAEALGSLWDLESVVKALRIEDALCVLSKFAS